MPAEQSSTPSLAMRASLLASYVLLVTINTLSGMGYLGPSQADVSGKWRTSLVPAAYAFSIWGVIFTLQGAGAVLAALPLGSQSLPGKAAAVNAVSIGWQLTWLFETAWLLLFPHQTTATFYASSALLFCGLAAIVWTAMRVYALLDAAPSADQGLPLSLWVLYVLPTSLNAAWMSVAACLGLDVLAVSQGLPAANELQLAATLAALVAAIGAYVVLRRRDICYGLTLVWAFVAVLRAHSDLLVIHTLSVVAIGAVSLCCGYVGVRHCQARSRTGRADSGVRASLLGGGDETARPAGSAGASTSQQ